MTLTQNNREILLDVLHTHGQQFLSAFGLPKREDVNDSDSEEWLGIGSPTSSEGHDGEFEQGDDDFVASSSHIPDVLVFLDATAKRPEAAGPSSKELRKSFMSSKVSNVTLSSVRSAPQEKTDESDDERTNTQNDALLHRLVHTKLLSGSLDPELGLDHAQKGRALAGRVLELTGEAKLGKGESIFRREQRNQAAKHVRDGLIRKQREREDTALGEAKNMGNYHPTLKRLYESDRSSTRKKKRARGLGMGVGRFAGGTLKISRDEIASVTGSGTRRGGHDRLKARKRPR